MWLLVTPTTAWASERATVALQFGRQGQAETQCPDEATFRALVAAKLGYDPFTPEAEASLEVTFASEGKGVSGTLRSVSAGKTQGLRTLRAADDDCYELAASLALAAAVAVDPDALVTGAAGSEPPATTNSPNSAASTPQPTAPQLDMPQSSAEPTPAVPEPAPQASPAKATAHPRALPPQTPLALRLSLGSEVPVGITPAPTAGAKLGLGLEGRRWLVLLEVNAALPSTQHSVYGDVSAWPAGTALLPCARPALGPNVALDVCAAARFGALFSHAEGVSRSVRQRVPLLGVGPRLGLEWLPWQSLGFALDLEATLPVTRVHLLIEDLGRRQEVWASARIGMIGGLSLLVRLN